MGPRRENPTICLHQEELASPAFVGPPRRGRFFARPCGSCYPKYLHSGRPGFESLKLPYKLASGKRFDGSYRTGLALECGLGLKGEDMSQAFELGLASYVLSLKTASGKVHRFGGQGLRGLLPEPHRESSRVSLPELWG